MDINEDLLKFCHSLPKIELHAHLNGCVRISTLRELAIYKGLDDVILSAEGYNDISSLNSHENKHSITNSPSATATTANNGKSLLPQYFNFFNLIHQLTTSLDIIQRITRETIEDFAADNVRYLEIRTSPKDRLEYGISKESYTEAVLAGIQDYYNLHTSNNATKSIDVRLILSIDRRESSTQALETAVLALKMQKNHPLGSFIVGIDLAGDPSLGSWDQWRPAFDLARTGGLKISLHCAEIWNEEESALMIRYHPDRLAHMVCMGSGLRNLLMESSIPVEICLTSNVKTGSVESYASHHFRDLYQKENNGKLNNGENDRGRIKEESKNTTGNLLVLCTDDPSQGIFDTTLSREYALAAMAFGLSKEELCRLAMSAVDATFLNTEDKERLRETMLTAMNAITV